MAKAREHLSWTSQSGAFEACPTIFETNYDLTMQVY
jgi:hypothetical protein